MATAPAPSTLRPHFDLYGVHVRREFSSPTACPWLRYNYVCTNRPEYRSWLEAWATHTSPVVPPSTPLPHGTSIWFGMSHLYQYAAALMCQHRDELDSLKMWQCGSVRSACMSKTEAYTEQSQECVGTALSEQRCKLVTMPKDSRCAPDAWVNVYGANGTRAAKLDAIPILPATPEDGPCGVGGLSWPSCSMSIQRFSFRGGHCAIIVHNHPAQFIQDGFAKLIHSLGIRMRKVATIVYSSPWFLHQAYRRKMCTCQGAPHTCLRMSEASIFHRKHFNQVRCTCHEEGWAPD
ncbi:hypothetical protein AB1Y20_009562 [Prymnesium parvum]|uniref:Uncharacterized protein n=1 Tax=Prymnesium parvum TaxID=97485 RepID=A0AB34K4L7_PRYPA